ncbi:MAG: aminotransferase class I/II-fold pyridoxal phosphate-dependent enzyme [bacterium]
MPLIPARRMQDIAPFHAMSILARARAMEQEGRDIIHLEVGEPDFTTLDAMVEAGIASLKQGKTQYTPAVGLVSLRQSISNYYQARFGVSVSPERIIITPGASGALQLILGAMINRGDSVLLTDPGYPANRHMVRLFGGVPRLIPLNAEQGFNLSISDVAKYWDDSTRAIMLATPSNPTGRLTPHEVVAAVLEFARKRDGATIVDEIYQGLVYDTEPQTALDLGQNNLFVVNSFSKYFGMTGWRIGWVVAPDNFVDELDRLAQNIFLAAPTTAQYAALAAFQPDSLAQLEARREIFRERRDFLYEALLSLGFRITGKPEGAFYLYADVSQLCDNSFKFCEELLEHTGVAITPGRDFGDHDADRFVRITYTTGIEHLKEAVDRIAAYLGSR